MSSALARREVQGALLSFTAHRFKEELQTADRQTLMTHFVGDADRRFQFWERIHWSKNAGRNHSFYKSLPTYTTIPVNRTGNGPLFRKATGGRLPGSIIKANRSLTGLAIMQISAESSVGKNVGKRFRFL